MENVGVEALPNAFENTKDIENTEDIRASLRAHDAELVGKLERYKDRYPRPRNRLTVGLGG